MTGYTAECRLASNDMMKAYIDDGDVAVEALKRGENQMEVFLRPAEARTFARGIIALADEIDGGEVAKERPPLDIKAGDRIRVLKDWPDAAGVRKGDEFIVRQVDETHPLTIKVDGDGTGGFWHLSRSSVELVEASAGEPASSSSPRARYVTEARELLEDTYFDAEHLVRLAEFLAAGD